MPSRNGENYLKALILAGGFATRLRPLSCTRPKILFPILNKPLLQWTYERLTKHSIREAVLAINYQTRAAIKQQRIPRNEVTVKYSLDPARKPLGSGGPIKKAEKLIGHDSPFLVLNGDIFANVDYTEIIRRHREDKAVATIALTEVEDPSRYGVADLAKDGRITKFIEKPKKGEAPSNLINAGVYVLSPKIFDYLPREKKVSIERDVFTKLAEEGKLYGHVIHDLWFDIGKPQDYLQIHTTLLKSFTNQHQPKIQNKAQIRHPVAFDRGVSIGKGSVIGPNVVVGKNVKIEDNVHIRDSVILPYTEISQSTTIEGAIIGDSVTIGKNAKISKGCILGDHVRIGDRVTLARDVSICPAKEVSKNVLTPKNIC